MKLLNTYQRTECIIHNVLGVIYQVMYKWKALFTTVRVCIQGSNT